MPECKSLVFEGLNAAVTLDVDERFLDALPDVFPNWPFVLSDSSTDPIFASVCFENAKYTISSPFMDDPTTYGNPVNAICSLIAELAWAHLRADPSLLCLHGAAVEINGRLIVFPNARRAGKSTMSVAMQAAGYRLFTDDFLPLLLDDSGHICGMSHGIAPRLRLPVPDQIGGRAQAYINSHGHISNRQYRYVFPTSREMASFGDSLPVGALIFLERVDGAAPTLQKLGQADILTNLLTQNFSRAMNAAGILEILDIMSKRTPAYTLQYSNVEPAIALLTEQLGNWNSAPAQVHLSSDRVLEEAPESSGAPTIANWQEAKLVQALGITEAANENTRFLSDPTGRNIHYMNAGATGIWRILESPANLEEIVEILCTVYPEQSADEIRNDAETTLRLFVENGLVRHADVGNTDNLDQPERSNMVCT